MAQEGTPSWLALPTAETNGAPPHKKGRSDDDRGSGGTKGLRETAKTMGRLVLAGSQGARRAVHRPAREGQQRRAGRLREQGAAARGDLCSVGEVAGHAGQPRQAGADRGLRELVEGRDHALRSPAGGGPGTLLPLEAAQGQAEQGQRHEQQ
eukprot:4783484-Pyramimonas_sp.AAC.1